MNSLIAFLWFFRTAKVLLFYLYFWQLKEYHIGRFKAHFETKEGKKLIFNKAFYIKAVLILFYFLSFFRFLFFIFFILLFFVYLFEFFKLFEGLIKKKLKLPVFTYKASFLLFILFLIEFIFLAVVFDKSNFLFYILLFDFFSPIITSLVILSFQPFTVFFRNLIIRRAKKKRLSFKNLKVVGIVGSYGKTSVKEFLSTILSEKYNVLKTPANINSEIGISNVILKELNFNHDIFVCEMGAYNKGGIKLLSSIAKPQIGIVSGINEQHLSTFKNMESLISAEGGKELLNHIPKSGFLAVNASSDLVFKNYKKYKDLNDLEKRKKTKRKKVYFSSPFKEVIDESKIVDIWTENIIENESSLSFDVKFKEGDSFSCRANLLGKHNIENLLLSIFVASKLGLTIEEIKRGLLKIEEKQGGASFLINKDDLKIIDSSYSINPNGAIALLNYLDSFHLKKIVIMPCLIELGSSSRKIHKKIGREIGKICDLAIITTKDYFQEIKSGAGIKKNNILYIKEPNRIVEKIKENRGAVLLMGRLNKEIINKLKEL